MKRYFFPILSFTVLIILIANSLTARSSFTAPTPCLITTETRTVRGASLEPLIHEVEKVSLLAGYYDCHLVERNDIVAYQYAGNSAPIIKQVKGIPGDTFALILADANAHLHIVVNGKILSTSEGISYALMPRKARMLALYVNDYHGIIPEKSYLILGNLPEGSLDSTRFGLVSEDDILGKVIYDDEIEK